EETACFGGLMFSIAPSNLLDHHATNTALDAPHAVQQKNQKPPQRNELEAPLGQMIVTRRRLVATRADCLRAVARSYVQLRCFSYRGRSGRAGRRIPDD